MSRPSLCAMVYLLMALPLFVQAAPSSTRPPAAPKDAQPLFSVETPLLEPEPPAPDATPDERLNQACSFSGQSRTLTDILAAISSITHVPLTAAPEISSRRATIQISTQHPLPLRTLMTTLAAVTSLSWRTDAQGYEIFQSDKQREREASQMRNAAAREAADRAALSAAMLSALQRAVRDRAVGRPSLGDLLAGFNQDQLGALAAIQAQPLGLISATDTSHLVNRTYGLRPFNALTPMEQAAVRAMAIRPEYYPEDRSVPHLAPAVDTPADLAQSQVGFVNSGGGVSLAVVPAGGSNIWISPGNDLVLCDRTGGRAGGEEDATTQALLSGLVLLLDKMSMRSRHMLVRFPTDAKHPTDRQQLTWVLGNIARQTGLPVVSDDFYQSRETNFAWLLTDQDQYTLEGALYQITHAFVYQCRYVNGVLRFRTLLRGEDLLAEPPDALMKRLRTLASAKPVQTAALSDYMMFGTLRDEQMHMLLTRKIPDLQGLLPSVLLNAQRLRSVLSFYASLSESERAKAETSTGLPLLQMDDAHKHFFLSIADVGLTKVQDTANNPLLPGFAVQHNTASNEWTFYVTSQSGRTTQFRL